MLTHRFELWIWEPCYVPNHQPSRFLFVFCLFFLGGEFPWELISPTKWAHDRCEVGSCQEMDGLATKFFYWSYCERSILDAHVHDECRKGRNNKELESCRSGRFLSKFVFVFLSFFLGLTTPCCCCWCLPVCSAWWNEPSNCRRGTPRFLTAASNDEYTRRRQLV